MIGSAKAQEGTLVGKIKSTGTLGGSIKSNGVLVASLSMPVGYDDYVGSYDIIPKIESQVMPTADKRLTKDITVQAIPYFEVSNIEGGKTVTIG